MAGESLAHLGVKVYCIHGGEVELPTETDSAQTADGHRVLRKKDVEGRPIRSCPVKPPGKPCLTVGPVIAGLVAGSTIDGDTPLLADFIALTDGVPPAICRAAGGPGAARTAPPSGGVRPCPAPARRATPAQKPAAAGRLVVRVHLDTDFVRTAGLVVGQLPGAVWVTVVQNGRWQDELVPLPDNGGKFAARFDLDPTRDAWAVVSSHPLVTALAQIEPKDAPPPFVGTWEGSPLKPRKGTEDFFARSYDTIARAAGSPTGLDGRTIALANGLAVEGGAKPRPAAGLVLRLPLRLPAGAKHLVVVRPSYPRLLALAAALPTAEDALADLGKYAADVRLFERLELAALSKELDDIPKFHDCFADVGNAYATLEKGEGEERLYSRFQRIHAERLPGAAGPLKAALAAVRDVVGSANDLTPLVAEYCLFTAASPLFLGLLDIPKSAGGPDTLLRLALAATQQNEAVGLVRRALAVLHDGLDLLERLQGAAAQSAGRELSDDEAGTWQRWMGRALAAWEMPGGAVATTPGNGRASRWPSIAAGPIRGWPLLAQTGRAVEQLDWRDTAAKDAQAFVQKSLKDVPEWLEKARRIAERWAAPGGAGLGPTRAVLKEFGIAPARVAKLAGDVAAEAKAASAAYEKGVRAWHDLAWERAPEPKLPGRSLARVERVRAATDLLDLRFAAMRWLFSGVLVWKVIAWAGGERSRERDAYRRYSRLVKDVNEVLKMSQELGETALVTLRRRVLTQRLVDPAGAARSAAQLRTTGNALKVAGRWLKGIEFVWHMAEAAHDVHLHNHELAGLRVLSAAVPLILTMVPGAGVPLGLAAGWWLDRMIDARTLSDVEQELHALLQQTEFGTERCGTWRSPSADPACQPVQSSPRPREWAFDKEAERRKIAERLEEAFVKGVPGAAKKLIDLRRLLLRSPWRLQAALYPDPPTAPGQDWTAHTTTPALVVSYQPAPSAAVAARARLVVPAGCFSGLSAELPIEVDSEPSADGKLLSLRVRLGGRSAEADDGDEPLPFCWYCDAKARHLAGHKLPAFLGADDSLVLVPSVKALAAGPVTVEGAPLLPGKDVVIVLAGNAGEVPPPEVGPPGVEFVEEVRLRLGELAKSGAALEILGPMPESPPNLVAVAGDRGRFVRFGARPEFDVLERWAGAARLVGDVPDRVALDEVEFPP
jgi:hypothetical protein